MKLDLMEADGLEGYPGVVWYPRKLAKTEIGVDWFSC